MKIKQQLIYAEMIVEMLCNEIKSHLEHEFIIQQLWHQLLFECMPKSFPCINTRLLCHRIAYGRMWRSKGFRIGRCACRGENKKNFLCMSCQHAFQRCRLNLPNK